MTYNYWRNILHPGAVKYEVGLTLLPCVQVGKWQASEVRDRMLSWYPAGTPGTPEGR